MNRILFLKTIVILFIGLNSCKEDKKTNYNILADSVGEFKLYDSVEAYKGKENIIEININKINTIGYLEDRDTLYYVSEVNSTNRIQEIIVLSNKMKLPNGIHLDMPIKSLVPLYPKIRRSMRRLTIPNLDIDFFEGNYWPKEFMKRNPSLNIQGVTLDFEEVEEGIKKDTILKVIRLKSNLYS